MAISREIVDISELSQFRLERVGQDVRMLSGRKREGFRLEGSDIDFNSGKITTCALGILSGPVLQHQ